MSAIYSNQPGYLIYHNPTKTDFKKASSTYQDKLLFNETKPFRNFKLPQVERNFSSSKSSSIQPPRIRIGLSYSQSVFTNSYGNTTTIQ